MSEKKQIRDIDRSGMCERLADNLRRTGQQMLDLADRLAADGAPLRTDQEALCRMAILSIIEDLQAQWRMQFLAGQHSDYLADTQYEITRWVEFLGH